MMIGIFLLFLISSCNSGLVDNSQPTSTQSGADQHANEDNLASESLQSDSVTDKEEPRRQPTQPLISLWKVEAGGKIRLPLPDPDTPPYPSYKFSVDWGDGTTGEVTSPDDPDASHTYKVASEQATGEGVHEGNYRITITGVMEAWGYNGNCPDTLVAIENLGNTYLKTLDKAFRGCKKLTQVKGGDTSSVTNMNEAFRGTGGSSLKLQINSWDTSKVETMAGMFADTKELSFECDEGEDSCDNANLKDWQTSKVSNMSKMFYDSKTANPDVSNWRTDSLTNVEMMFYQAKGANPNVSNWNFSKIIYFSDFVNESNISNDNYCNLIVALGENIPSNISNNAGHRLIGMSGTDCANHDNFCQAKQVLKDDDWEIVRDATSCPQQ